MSWINREANSIRKNQKQTPLVIIIIEKSLNGVWLFFQSTDKWWTVESN